MREKKSLLQKTSIWSKVFTTRSSYRNIIDISRNKLPLTTVKKLLSSRTKLFQRAQAFRHSSTMIRGSLLSRPVFSRRSYHVSGIAKWTEQPKIESSSANNEIIVHQNKEWIIYHQAIVKENAWSIIKGLKYFLLTFGGTLVGFTIDTLIKRRSENLSILEDIRQSMEIQYQKNRQLLDDLPVRESQLGFYLYANPHPDRLKKIDEQSRELLKLLEQNRRLEERINNLNMSNKRNAKSWLPREDYHQMRLLQQELIKQQARLELAWQAQSAFDYYIHQQYEQALQCVNKGIEQLTGNDKPGILEKDKHNANKDKAFSFEQEERQLLLAALYHMQAKTYKVLNDIPKAIVAYKNSIVATKVTKRGITADFQATILSDYGLLLSEEASYCKERLNLQVTHQLALQQHQDAYAVNPHSATIMGNYGRGLHLQSLELTDLAQRQKQLVKARALFDRAIMANPKSATLRLYRGILFMDLASKQDKKQQFYRQALADFNKGLIEQPNHTSLLCRRAVVNACLATEQYRRKQVVAASKKDLLDLKAALLIKEDWLVGVNEKLNMIKKINEQVDEISAAWIFTPTFDCRENSNRCYAIARFFYHKPITPEVEGDTPEIAAVTTVDALRGPAVN